MSTSAIIDPTILAQQLADNVNDIKRRVDETTFIILSGTNKHVGDVYLKHVDMSLISDDLTIGGNLTIDDCDGEFSLPKKLKCKRLYIQNVHDGDINVHAGVYATGIVCISQCSANVSISSGAYFKSNLCLEACTGKVKLHEGLRVRGSFIVNETPLLFTLPSKMYITKDLSIMQSDITKLPADMKVSRDINISVCRNISGIPDEILAWKEKRNGGIQTIYMLGTTFSLETWEHILARNTALRFRAYMPCENQVNTAEKFSCITSALVYWYNLLGDYDGDILERVSPIVDKVDTCYKRGITQFLEKLTEAKEFTDAGMRKKLAYRVIEAFDTISQSGDIRIAVLNQMADAADACSDKPIWALNQIYTTVLINRARGNERMLRVLGERMMRLSIVHKHADRVISTIDNVDDVCIYLRFEIDLREVLHLPISATAMLFPNYMQVSNYDLNLAAIEALSVTPQALENWLDNWCEWKRFKREIIAKTMPFDSIRKLETTKRPRDIGDVEEGVMLLPSTDVWEYSMLICHWIATGKDLYNVMRDGSYISQNLVKI